MIRRIRFLLVALPLCGLAIAAFAPTVPEAAAQNDGERRDDGENGGRRGEGRGRFGRGRFGNGEGGGERGEGRGRFDRGGEGFRERGRGRGSEDSGDERGSRSSGPSSTSSSEKSGGSSSSASSLSLENYARGVVKEHDKDGDMMLKGDELKGLSSKAASADLDKDGVITTNELVTTFSGNAPASSSTTAATSASGRGEGSGSENSENGDRGRRGERRRDRERNGEGDSPGSSNGEKSTRVYTALPAGGKAASGAKTEKVEAKRTYRFSTGTDRLPSSGLPSWFKSRDANGNGQIEMSEYSRSWSDRMVSEFHRYDRNNDGIVTAKEAAEK